MILSCDWRFIRTIDGSLIGSQDHLPSGTWGSSRCNLVDEATRCLIMVRYRFQSFPVKTKQCYLYCCRHYLPRLKVKKLILYVLLAFTLQPVCDRTWDNLNTANSKYLLSTRWQNPINQLDLELKQELLNKLI